MEISRDEIKMIISALRDDNPNGTDELVLSLMSKLAAESESLNYVIVRSNGSGCWFGQLKSRNGSEVTLTAARRLWYWAGAASLSELAQRGTSKPHQCKFPVAVEEVIILNILEILKTTREAQDSIKGVPVWSE